MKKVIIAFYLVFTMLFSGCGFANIGAENLLYAPKMTEEQSLVHQALIDSVGKNIKLKYPRSGENRSSFVITNLDNEDSNEAVALYESTSSTQSIVRINILDQVDGAWKSVYDVRGAGIEVDNIMIARLGENEPINIIIGFGAAGSSEKTLCIYRYGGGVVEEVYNDVYTSMDLMDLNVNGVNELITVTNSSESSKATAKMFKSVNGVITCFSGVDLDSGILSYSSFVKGKIFDDTSAIFIDGLTGNGTLKTEILIFRNGGMQNIMSSKYNRMIEKTTRPTGYSSIDVDNDGVVEIPVTTAFTGYEAYLPDEQLLLTDWYTYEGYFSLEKKYSSYYNITDAYVFMIPSRWQGLVTVKIDTVTDEIVFYRFSGEITDNMTELMRIRVSIRQETNDLVYKGYSVITSKGQLDYLVKLGEGLNQSLTPTMAEVTNNFYVL